jgi:hypothetical protein
VLAETVNGYDKTELFDGLQAEFVLAPGAGGGLRP